jgi:hypothetical protein
VPVLALDPHTATSWVAVTGLSYPTISVACAPEYQLIQISPLSLTRLSARAVSPTCVARVRPLPAARGRDWLPALPHARATRIATGPVSVSPILDVASRFKERDWVEQGVAALSARCNAASPIRGTALQQVAVEGW